MQGSRSRAVPRHRKVAQVVLVTTASDFISAAAVSPAEPRDHNDYLVRVDAGVGRCPGAGAMQNMQEWSQ